MVSIQNKKISVPDMSSEKKDLSADIIILACPHSLFQNY